jgi:hypothetical protein
MSGRGDNNKHGTSGQGASNQSNQAFIADNQDQPKSNHNKHQTGSEPSIPQAKTVDQSANRNTALVDEPQEKPEEDR